MKRVNCLYRVSSRQQLYEDDIPIQRAECMQYLNTHVDWIFQKEYVEKAVSGFKMAIKDRDVLQEILKDARQKSFDVLLVYISDRIGRKEDESPVFVTTLNNLGIEVWTVKEGQLKTTEHIDKLLNYIRFWQAEGESRKTGMRVKDAQETLVKTGKFVGGKAPFGYRLEYSGEISNHGRALKHLVIEPERAAVIQMIYDYAVCDNYGSLKIAKELNRQKIPAPNDIWKAATVSQILQNPVYMGYITYNRRQKKNGTNRYERIPKEQWILAQNANPDLVIIPEQVWQQAQKMRKMRTAPGEKSDTKKSFAVKNSMLLSGFLVCGYCKSPLSNGSKYTYWRTKDGSRHKKIRKQYCCRNRISGSIECNGAAYYQAERIDKAVDDAIAAFLNQLPKEDMSEALRKRNEEIRIQKEKAYGSRKKQAEAMQEDIKTLKDHIPAAIRGEGLFDAEQLAALLEEKEKEQQECLRKLQEAEKAYQMAVKDSTDAYKERCLVLWGELYLACDVSKKRVILAKLIDCIEVKDNILTIYFKDG